MLDILMPLQRLTALGMAVLILHHPRKGETIAGQAARGSGALSGYVDIILEMQYYSEGADDDRRRRIQAYSRYQETPRQLVIELTADGTDYRAHGDFQQDEFAASWKLVQAVLEEATCKQTRQQVLDQWPGHLKPPNEVTLWKWLDRAVAQGLLCQDGFGHKNDPFYYWLPGQIEAWRQDPIAKLHLDQQQAMRTVQGLTAGDCLRRLRRDKESGWK
jgi:hypothetical protein